MSVRYTATLYWRGTHREGDGDKVLRRSGNPGRGGGGAGQVSVARSQKNFRPVHLKSSANLGKSSANFQKHHFHNALFSCSVYEKSNLILSCCTLYLVITAKNKELLLISQNSATIFFFCGPF